MSFRSVLVAPVFLAAALAPFSGYAGETLPVAAPATAADAGKSPVVSYLRYKDDFEVLVREFRNEKTGKTVTLAGMVHIADSAFYTKIGELADKQDLVLVEGVKGGGFGGLGIAPLLYQMYLAKRLLEPANLADQIDYFRSEGGNRMNADVNASEIGENGGGGGFLGFVTFPLVAALGETAYTLEGLGEQFCFFTGTSDALARGSRDILASALTGHDREPGENSEFDRVIIGHRNTAVLKVLDEELKKPAISKVCIPWGAAHHVGLEAALLERGFKPAGDRWITAIAVKSLDSSPETDPGFRYRFPYLLNIRNSDTAFEFDAPLSLIHTSSSPRLKQTIFGWGLLHFDRETDNDISATDLMGLLRLRSEDKSERKKSFSFLLGLYGDSSSPKHDEFHFGWWGFLGGAEATRNETGAPGSSGWHLPLTFGKYPLFYGQKSDATTGETEHRFLLFFKTTSGK